MNLELNPRLCKATTESVGTMKTLTVLSKGTHIQLQLNDEDISQATSKLDSIMDSAYGSNPISVPIYFAHTDMLGRSMKILSWDIYGYLVCDPDVERAHFFASSLASPAAN